jgi:hypothetical protein
MENEKLEPFSRLSIFSVGNFYIKIYDEISELEYK